MISKSLYQIEMSTDGKHKVVIKIEDPAGTDAALAWARATYAKLLRDDDLAASQSQAKSTESVIDDDDPPMCGVHDVEMILVRGRKGPFWCCHEKNDDGSWCT